MFSVLVTLHPSFLQKMSIIHLEIKTTCLLFHIRLCTSRFRGFSLFITFTKSKDASYLYITKKVRGWKSSRTMNHTITLLMWCSAIKCGKWLDTCIVIFMHTSDRCLLALWVTSSLSRFTVSHKIWCYSDIKFISWQELWSNYCICSIHCLLLLYHHSTGSQTFITLLNFGWKANNGTTATMSVMWNGDFLTAGEQLGAHCYMLLPSGL